MQRIRPVYSAERNARLVAAGKLFIVVAVVIGALLYVVRGDIDDERMPSAFAREASQR
jgi:hypothetical protein